MLGEHQSGDIAEVGFDLYNRMLKSAVKALKNGESIDFENHVPGTTDINIHAPALIPADYVTDVSQRLAFYKELASATTYTDLIHTAEALGDRYGKLPEAAERLIRVHRLRLKCEDLGVKKIDASESSTLFTFVAKPNLDPMALIRLLQTRRDARMAGPEKLRLSTGGATPEARFGKIDEILAALSANPTETIVEKTAAAKPGVTVKKGKAKK